MRYQLLDINYFEKVNLNNLYIIIQIDYISIKFADVQFDLIRYFPDGIDIYFDNVGEKMLEGQEAVVERMNIFGRVAVCGMISEYTNEKIRAAPTMVDVVYKRITIQGFFPWHYLNLFPKFVSRTSDHLRAGKIQLLEDIYDGVENIPFAIC